MVKNLFADRNRDFVTELDEQNIILIKDATDLKTEEDALHLAKTIVDNLHAEAMVRVRVGYGNTVNTLQDIAKSYQEAKIDVYKRQAYILWKLLKKRMQEKS